MNRGLSLSRLFVAAVLAIPLAAHAQRPDRVAVGSTPAAQEPLPLLDDFGTPITEAEIKRYQKRNKAKWYLQPFGLIAGAALGYGAVPKGPSEDNCSIYDPCSDREKFYRSSGALVGGVVGILLMNAAGPGLDRYQAIQVIREERRLIHMRNVP